VADYGLDLSTAGGDIDPLMPLISGRQVVLESCARRLQTPRGFFRWAPDYGYDLRSKMGARMSVVQRLRISNDIEAELNKDDRVRSAKVVSFTSSEEGRWKIKINVTLAEGTFSLIVAASALTVELLTSEVE
jgi:hypothetical protein